MTRDEALAAATRVPSELLRPVLDKAIADERDRIALAIIASAQRLGNDYVSVPLRLALLAVAVKVRSGEL